MPIESIDHVQLAMPAGREADARNFYAELLGIPEVCKPANLAVNGGAWFEREGLRVHLGVDPDFRAAKKAHVAFRVKDLAALASDLEAAGVAVLHDNRLPGFDRFYASDPFGNRLEFMEP
ncbi:MAG: VOC family protein [Planctomycetes bacterium]|nr:VOC family protein [Planctomycetota bacterium]